MVVTNLNDSGAGSLRQAMLDASDGDSITFAAGVSGTISLASELTGLQSVTLVNAEGITLSRSGSLVQLSSEETVTDILSGMTLNMEGDNNSNAVSSSASLTMNGGVSSDVTADMGAGFAVGLSVNGSLVVNGGLGGSIDLSSESGELYGIYTNGTTTINDGLTGSITAVSQTGMVHGMYSTSAVTVSGGLSGTITAQTGGDAVGIRSFGDATISGGLSGTVSAEGLSATGLNISDDLIINDGLSGTVSASSTTSSATGMYGNTITINGGFSGNVQSSAPSYSMGMFGGNSLDINDGFSGTVQASSTGTVVHGLYSNGAIAIDGGLSGTLSAISTGSNEAYGVYVIDSFDDGSGGAVDVSGTVTAEGQGVAVGIMSGRILMLNVSGTISAVDHSGAGLGYAIVNGSRNGSGGVNPGGGDAVVTLADGVQLTGHIELGTGANTLTMNGSGVVDGNIYERGTGTVTKAGTGTWQTGSILANALDVQAGELQISISQTGSATITTTGALNNDGEILLTPSNLVASGTTFTAVTTGGLTGTGTFTTPMFTQNVVGNDIQLTKIDYSSLASGSHSGFASALNSAIGGASGDFATILQGLDSAASVGEFSERLDQLEGLTMAGLNTQVVDMARFSAGATQQRMAEVRRYHALLDDEDAMDPNDPATWPTVAAVGDLSGLLGRTPEANAEGVHLRLLGRTGDMDSYQGLTGYDYVSMVFSGGYDRVVMDNLLIGVSGGYSSTDAQYKDSGSSDSTVDSYSLGFYGSWFKNDWYVDALVSGAYNRYEIDREIAFLGRTAESDPDGYTGAIKVAGGYRYAYGDYGLTPMASVEYTRFHRSSYSEDGAGAANLSVGSVDSNFFETGLGGKVDRVWETAWGHFIPEVSATWKHEWLTQDRTLSATMSGTSFSDEAPEGGRDTLVFGTGFQALFSQGHSLGLRYSGEIEEHASSHALQLDLLFTY